MSESSAEAVASAASAAVAAASATGAGGWRRATGIAGAAIGVIAAGAAAGVALERMTVGRGMRAKARLVLDSAGPYGGLRGTPGKAYADDGTELYYEVDDVEPQGDRRTGGAGSSGARPRSRSPSSSATATASARTPGTSSGRPCGAWCGPCTGTSAVTAGPGAATPRCGTVCRSASTSWGGT